MTWENWLYFVLGFNVCCLVRMLETRYEDYRAGFRRGIHGRLRR